MFFLLLFLILITLLILVIFSKIEINVRNIRFTSYKVQERHLQEDYNIEVKLYVLKFLRLLKINITKEKLEKLKLENKIKKLEKKLILKDVKFDVNVFDVLKNLKIIFEELNLKVEIGTENSALTSIIFGIVSGIIPIILRNQIKNIEKQKIDIKPVYLNENLLNIELNCIFNIKMIHIIYVMYILNKKRRDEKYVRTSNRRSYGYSYE